MKKMVENMGVLMDEELIKFEENETKDYVVRFKLYVNQLGIYLEEKTGES